MDDHLTQKLLKRADTKIILLVIDGLGGLPDGPEGLTELESAYTPNLDSLAAQSICGLQLPIGPGITPGSGPSHLALFGYDPIKYQVGRGVLAALGIDFELTDQDVAARGNFATLDEKGRVADRRAGRISTSTNKKLCEQLQQIEIPDTEVCVEAVKEHRFLLVLRGEGLSGNLSDTDPQEIGKEPLQPKPLSSEAEKTCGLVKIFLDQAREILAGHHPANMVLLRGVGKRPSWPSMKERFGLDAAAIAGYPMYRGLARLVGMQVQNAGDQMDQELGVLENHWTEFDFFYVHFKGTDSAGEDGDFDRKASLIGRADTFVPRLLSLNPDVIIVTGDHSTPTPLKYHSWHPVPVLLWSKYCRPDGVKKFAERACMSGGLGPRIPAVDLMPLALANAQRLGKFGA